MPKRINLSGKIINHWKVNEYLGNQKYQCTCLMCNNEYSVDTYKLSSGLSKSCAKCASKLNGEKQRQKLEGTTVNDWNILEYLGDGLYLCQCKCGNTEKITSHNLLNNKTHRCKECNNKLMQETNREKLEGTRIGEVYIEEYMGNGIYKCRCSCNNTYEISAHSLKTNKYNMCPNCFKLNWKNSKFEISELIKEYNIEYNNEFDIFIPEKRVAIELNGTHENSSLFKGRNYHQDKTIACAKQGIQLIHIFEYEWNDNDTKRKLIDYIRKTVDNSKLKRVYARNTIIKQVDIKESKEFLNRYHIQGYTNANIRIGLYCNSELIALMTFGKPRFDSEHDYELIRLAFKSDISIIGGAEKLFKYFIAEYNPTSIVCYCDISKFTGKVYSRLEFKTCENNITKPSHVWVNTSKNDVLPRYKTMKQRLIEQGLGTENQTEDEIMNNLGYYKVYNCGNLKLIWNK